jgi:isopenicillin N synthase-like dioxygenase
VFATARELPPDYFDKAFVDAQCVLRLSHFPPTSYRDNQFGLAPHTDANFFTVLPQANVEGLYIRPEGKGWIKAPRIPGSFVINAGDMCRRWTNDRFLSTRHLAINLTDRQRYSTPFFYTPHIDWPIECLPTCRGPGNPPRYPPITYGEYRVWWLNTNYGAKLDQGKAQTAAE